MNGPLVGEEMLGACFVIDEIEVIDKKAVDFLCDLAKGVVREPEEEEKIEEISIEEKI